MYTDCKDYSKDKKEIYAVAYGTEDMSGKEGNLFFTGYPLTF